MVPFFLFWLYDYITNFGTFSNKVLLYEFFALIFFLIYSFYEKIRTIVFYPLYHTISFWICVGLFTYFSGNFFVTIFLTQVQDNESLVQMRLIYSIVLSAKNFILALSLFGNDYNEKDNETEFKLPDDVVLDEFKLTNLNKT